MENIINNILKTKLFQLYALYPKIFLGLITLNEEILYIYNN